MVEPEREAVERVKAIAEGLACRLDRTAPNATNAATAHLWREEAAAVRLILSLLENRQGLASVSGGVQKENMVREPSSDASVGAATAADAEALARANGTVRRLELRIADLLEIARQWEPDHASAEHRSQLFWAREARHDARVWLERGVYRHAGGAELGHDQPALTALAAGQSLNGLARDGSPALTHHSQAGSEPGPRSLDHMSARTINELMDARANASEARVEELRQALATVCPADPGEGWPDDAWLVIEGRIGGLPTRATVADFRRARSLLSREG